MAVIRLERGTKGANMFRKFKVFIDNECVGKIKRGQELELQISEDVPDSYCKIKHGQIYEIIKNCGE